jgi:deoxyribodipyrimidine photo-lyase
VTRPTAADETFHPSRAAGLERLRAFLPHAGRDYAQRRNHDLGPDSRVSRLSPWLRHRLVTEAEVIEAVLGRHSPGASEKFVQEVLWRSYWKGWLELRPRVWRDYQRGRDAALHRLAAEEGLRRDWEDACLGRTGIEGFDHWARELADTGWLHNHARMWFASIWIFTLRLPWELGADFFLRHLLDGDPASNTLSWRWVGGLQTVGKTYLARADNIAAHTGARFNPRGLATEAPPLRPEPHPAPRLLPETTPFDPAAPTVLLLTEEDLSPGFLFDEGLRPLATQLVALPDALSPLAVAPAVAAFKAAALNETAGRWADRLGPVRAASRDLSPAAVAAWAVESGARQVVTAYAPVGPVADWLAALQTELAARGVDLCPVLRPEDARAWPHATHGFFSFWEKARP